MRKRLLLGLSSALLVAGALFVKDAVNKPVLYRHPPVVVMAHPDTAGCYAAEPRLDSIAKSRCARNKAHEDEKKEEVLFECLKTLEVFEEVLDELHQEEPRYGIKDSVLVQKVQNAIILANEVMGKKCSAVFPDELRNGSDWMDDYKSAKEFLEEFNKHALPSTRANNAVFLK
jgi:hypothetical protein